MWKVELSRESRKYISKSEKKVVSSILSKIKNFKEWLEDKGPLSTDVKRLKGNWEGFYRIRVGNIRIILSLDRDKKIIRIHDIGHRGDVYKT